MTNFCPSTFSKIAEIFRAAKDEPVCPVSYTWYKFLPFEDLQQQNRQSQADLKQLYKQQHGQHKQDTIEDTIKSPTTAKARMNHQVNLQVPAIPGN